MAGYKNTKQNNNSNLISTFIRAVLWPCEIIFLLVQTLQSNTGIVPLVVSSQGHVHGVVPGDGHVQVRHVPPCIFPHSKSKLAERFCIVPGSINWLLYYSPSTQGLHAVKYSRLANTPLAVSHSLVKNSRGQVVPFFSCKDPAQYWNGLTSWF